jgi:hypothetical protein
MVFAFGKASTYFPGLPQQVVVFTPERMRPPARRSILIKEIATLPLQRPLPGWTPRLEFLRRMTSRGRS